jgi:nicotinamidase-related amidase
MVGDTALFVIDIQNDLATDPKTRIPKWIEVRQAGTQLLSAARAMIAASKMDGESLSLIVHVQHEEKSEDGPLQRGTEPWKLVFEPIEGSDNEWLVPKTTRTLIDALSKYVVYILKLGDTFKSNPDLAGRLHDAGIQNIKAFGIQSQCCVLETCKGALEAGFSLVILRGAHSTYDTGEKLASEIELAVEEEIQRLGGSVLNWQDWITGVGS